MGPNQVAKSNCQTRLPLRGRRRLPSDVVRRKRVACAAAAEGACQVGIVVQIVLELLEGLRWLWSARPIDAVFAPPSSGGLGVLRLLTRSRA